MVNVVLGVGSAHNRATYLDAFYPLWFLDVLWSLPAVELNCRLVLMLIKWIVGTAQHDQSSREECEGREMTECLRSSQERCTGYAREICDPIFSNVRIAAPGAPIDPRFNGRRLQRPRVSRHDKVIQKLPKKSCQAEQTGSQGILQKTFSGAETSVEERSKLGVTTFRGRLVMQYEGLGERERSSRQRPQGIQGNGASSIQQSSTLPGFVGGLVHPVVQSTDLPNSVENHVVAKVPVILRLDWWQKLQQLWLDRVRFWGMLLLTLQYCYLESACSILSVSPVHVAGQVENCQAFWNGLTRTCSALPFLRFQIILSLSM